MTDYVVTFAAGEQKNINVTAPVIDQIGLQFDVGRIKITGTVSAPPVGFGKLPDVAFTLMHNGNTAEFECGDTSFEATFNPSFYSGPSFRIKAANGNYPGGTTTLTITSIQVEAIPKPIYNHATNTLAGAVPLEYMGMDDPEGGYGGFFNIDDVEGDSVNYEGRFDALMAAETVAIVGRYDYTLPSTDNAYNGGSLLLPAPVAVDPPLAMNHDIAYVWRLMDAPAWGVAGVWNLVQVSVDGSLPKLAAVFGGVPGGRPA